MAQADLGAGITGLEISRRVGCGTWMRSAKRRDLEAVEGSDEFNYQETSSINRNRRYCTMSVLEWYVRDVMMLLGETSWLRGNFAVLGQKREEE